MKRITTWQGVAVVGLWALGGVTISRAADLMIQSCDGTGRMTFNEVLTAQTYRVEWAPSPSGPWTNSWAALTDIAAKGTGIVTCAVPMCYRVVATVTNATPTPSMPAGMVLIPAGTNTGTDPDYGAYSLTASAFYMDRTLVTKAQWDEIYSWALAHGYTLANSGAGKATNHPVQAISWHDSAKWCNARSEKEGRPVAYFVAGAVYRGANNNSVTCAVNVAGYRLPTDVEYEYAARGGVSGLRFPWGDTIDHMRANYMANPAASGGYAYDTGYAGYDTRFSTTGNPYTNPVDTFAANGFGLHDMAGNLWEWCTEWSAGSEGTYRIVRGGSWSDRAVYCRFAYRGRYGPGNAPDNFGFRAVLLPGP